MPQALTLLSLLMVFGSFSLFPFFGYPESFSSPKAYTLLILLTIGLFIVGVSLFIYSVVMYFVEKKSEK